MVSIRRHSLAHFKCVYVMYIADMCVCVCIMYTNYIDIYVVYMENRERGMEDTIEFWNCSRGSAIKADE